ncbi:ABC transporter ATP-binding protein [Leptolyngbya iicbica]|uniref:ABC-type quaternary amine transporter n=2 Tax=Cyanophyceae TaxID=3028117 RepID=A0A4Q7E155_9CYAN|nr:ABC transporter ATP-binding protein [Leptolyngbya sp. LK]RZM74450.1 ABC transporter ATP-binding protein [Leptolyngbya sp. LK]
MGNILFEQVTLKFAGMARPAVDQVTCEIQSGELVVILGPSGCGKTTLLKMVNRLYEPTKGRITMAGQNIKALRPTTLRQKIGYVIQQSGLFPHMTVANNVAVVPKLLKWPMQKIQARVDELLDLVKLPPADYRDRYPAQLSGGQQQRVGIARALAGNPDYMLMDEPFGAIDAITRNALQAEILRLHQQLKKTILFVSHDVDEALRLGDRIIVMNAGRIVQFDTPFKLLTQPADPFVHQLLGADDMVRQLGQVPVDAALMPLPAPFQPGQHPVVEADANLRDALSIILKTGAPELTVVRQGEPVGRLTLDHIRTCAREHNH